jgi:hypothetical protein
MGSDLFNKQRAEGRETGVMEYWNVGRMEEKRLQVTGSRLRAARWVDGLGVESTLFAA